MEEQNTERNLTNEDSWKEIDKSHKRGKVMGGLLIVAIGALFLGRELGFEIPVWVFTWKVLLIGLGLVLAVKHKFLHAGWLVLVAVGGAFLLNDLYPEMQIKPVLWPSLIILVGLFIIFKPRRKHSERMRQHWGRWHHRGHHYKHGYHEKYEHFADLYNREEPSKEDFIESTSIMAGVKKNVLSKNFKGGEIVNVFGGSELNLSQADFESSATLEITQVFGGTKLIVPANWEIRSEQTVTMLGSIEDKRASQPSTSGEPAKVLIITGVTVFGGIDIRSY